MYSVDLSDVYYRNPTKPCGYLINEIDSSERKFHQLLTGKVLPERFEEIGEGIQIRGFIISDDQPQQEGYKGIPIYFLSKVPKEYTDAFVIMSFISSDVETMLENKGYEYLALPYSLMEMINLK